MSVRLHVVPVSPACAAAEAALRAQGIPYARVTLPPGLERGPLPALDGDGAYVTGARAIFERAGLGTPAGAAAAAERFAEEELEPAAVRIAWATIRRDPRTLRSYLAGSSRRVPRAAMILRSVRAAGADDMTVRDDMHALPEQLERVDGWIEEGVLGAGDVTAADLRVAAPVRLLLTLGDVRPLVEGRPCAALARRLLPDLPGEVPSRVMPDPWLPLLAPA
jgi:glutathione S-transferase